MITDDRRYASMGWFGIIMLLLVFLACVGSAHCQDLPDNPHPQPEVTSPKFFQFRGTDDPQNATNRQVWHSKVFVAAQEKRAALPSSRVNYHIEQATEKE